MLPPYPSQSNWPRDRDGLWLEMLVSSCGTGLVNHLCHSSFDCLLAYHLELGDESSVLLESGRNGLSQESHCEISFVDLN